MIVPQPAAPPKCSSRDRGPQDEQGGEVGQLEQSERGDDRDDPRPGDELPPAVPEVTDDRFRGGPDRPGDPH